MTPERWQRIKALFNAAAEREPDGRRAFLDEACATDRELRQYVESLLAHDGKRSGLLQSEFEAGEWLADERERVVRDAFDGDEQLRHGIGDLVERSGQPSAGDPAPGLPARFQDAKLTPGELVGPYRVVEFLGAGGMGEVYKAVDTRLGRAVALKLLSASEVAPVDIQRFEREARAASALNHPNICTVYDIGESRGEPLLVMELLDGQTLAALIAGGSLAVDRVLDLGIQIAEGLEAAHAAGIIHRDIKPANIFVSSRGQAKILDFGLAKTAGLPGSDDEPGVAGEANATALLTTPGSNPGTPGYMSPEQARGEELDVRSDLFSFGLVLLEMVTGKATLAGASRSRLRAVVANREAVAMHLDRGVSRLLGRVLRRAVANQPNDRYQTASELLEDLRRAARSRAGRPPRAAALLLGIAVISTLAVLALRRGPVPAPNHGDWIQITNFSDSAVEPGLSPDGRMLTFIRAPRTFTSVGQVYVMRLPDGEPRRLTDDGRTKMSPVFSPDGSSVAYTTIDENWAWDTWRVPISGGPASPLVANASGLSWIGRGELLFSEVRVGTHMSIVTGDDQRNGVREVYVPPRHTGMAHRSYLSPDRRSVLLTEMELVWLPCRLVPFDGSSRGREVGPPGASCTSAAWAPDGRWMYFSSNAGGAFHLWRQEFPNGTLHQVTSGAAEEEGIAIAPDGRSLITSVGTGVSTIWIRNGRGERPLSEQGHSFLPRFSRDGGTVFYLVSERPGAFLANAGELWSIDLPSGVRRRLGLSDAIVNYSVDTDRNAVLYVTVGEKSNATLWRAPMDGRTPPHKLADDVGRALVVTAAGIMFSVIEGPDIYIYVMDADGRSRRKALPQPVSGFRAASPDGRWLVVQDRTPVGTDRAPIVLYPLGADARSRMPICSACFVSWVLDGRYLSVRFSGSSDAEQRTTYLLPIPPGELLPAVFRQGRLIPETEVAATPGVRPVHRGDVTFGADADTYVYPQLTSHRNLFRIPLE